MSSHDPLRDPGDSHLVALVIEDDRDMLQLLDDFLHRQGIRAVCIEPGPALLDEVLDLRFDFVVTDLVMPAIDGLQVIRGLRRARPGIPILAISGGSASLPAELGLLLAESFGATAFLYKPFSRNEFGDAVQRLIKPPGAVH